MSRPLSVEGELKQVRVRLRKTDLALKEAIERERAYRARVSQAEQQIAEWKQRFDALLKIVQSSSQPEGK